MRRSVFPAFNLPGSVEEIEPAPYPAFQIDTSLPQLPAEPISEALVATVQLHQNLRDLCTESERKSREIRANPINQLPAEVLADIMAMLPANSRTHFMPGFPNGQPSAAAVCRNGVTAIWIGLARELQVLRAIIDKYQGIAPTDPQRRVLLAELAKKSTGSQVAVTAKELIKRQQTKINTEFATQHAQLSPAEYRVACPSAPSCPSDSYAEICCSLSVAPCFDVPELFQCFGGLSVFAGAIMAIVGMVQGCTTSILASSLSLILGGLCIGVSATGIKCCTPPQANRCDIATAKLTAHNKAWGQCLSDCLPCIQSTVSYPCDVYQQSKRVRIRRQELTQLQSKMQEMTGIKLQTLLRQQMAEDQHNGAIILECDQESILENMQFMVDFLAAHNPQLLTRLIGAPLVAPPMPSLMR